MAPEEAACNRINYLHWCQSTRFWKAVRWPTLHSYNTAGLIMGSLKNKCSKSVEQNHIALFNAHILLCFAYITHSATQLLCDITGGNLSNYLQLLLEPQKAIYPSFNICSSNSRSVNTHKCVKMVDLPFKNCFHDSKTSLILIGIRFLKSYTHITVAL